MDLLDQLRSLHQAEAVLPMVPSNTMDASLGMGIGLDGGFAASTSAGVIVMQIAALIGDASDHDLLAAYRRTDGEDDAREAGTLLAEIQRRDLDV